jgi:hypothetical protein
MWFTSIRAKLFWSTALIISVNWGMAWSEEPFPSGDATIRAAAGNSEIVIRTTERLAGAIHSLTWNGREFIDSADHGRQLQSASNFDAGLPLTAETFNPTEAGSRKDGAGPKSTSRLLHLIARGNQLQTTSQMAFWLGPHEKSEGNSAKNAVELSNHLVTKRVRIGHRELPHVIQYDVSFSIPIDEQHGHGVFEAVTGYMPAEFEVFLKYDAKKDSTEALDDGPGEQSFPIIFANQEGTHAMGVYSPDQPSRGYESAGYGRFRFRTEKVVKWNCVFRTDGKGQAINPGEYSFRNFVIVGDLATVKQSLRELRREYAP